MSRRIVRLAVVSAASAAALGVPVATVIAVADTPSTTVQAATTTHTPVRLADGRTVTVKGLPTVHYTATGGHRDAVQAAATANPADGSVPGTNPNASSSPSADLPGIGTNPTGTGTYDPSQVTTQASGGVIGIGVAGMLIFGGLLIYGVKENKISKGQAIIAVGFGVFAATTFVGTFYHTAISSGASMVSGFTG